MKDKVVATLVVHDVTKLSQVGRNRVSRWLKEQAEMIQFNSNKISKRYRARYLVTQPQIETKSK